MPKATIKKSTKPISEDVKMIVVRMKLDKIKAKDIKKYTLVAPSTQRKIMKYFTENKTVSTMKPNRMKHKNPNCQR